MQCERFSFASSPGSSHLVSHSRWLDSKREVPGSIWRAWCKLTSWFVAGVCGVVWQLSVSCSFSPRVVKGYLQ